jgi:hypothetical protein
LPHHLEEKNVANQEQPIQPGATPAAPNLPPRGLARRRFTRVGLVVSGTALTTVANATGLSVHACASPSGSLSGGLHSRSPDALPETCDGLSPGGWKNTGGGETWPVNRETFKFSDFYACGNGFSKRYVGLTMLQVLDPQSFGQKVNRPPDTAGLGRHLVAAFLNARSGKVNVLTELALKKIWQEYCGDGTYSPAAGVNWDACQIVRYISTHTFHNGQSDAGEECGFPLS